MTELSAGDRIGDRTVTRLIGRGGMGAVYEVDHEGRREALKLLTDFDDAEGLARFQREAEVMARVSRSPHIVSIYSVDARAIPPWIAMEFIEGRTLEELIPAGGLPVERITAILRGVLAGLQTIHDADILHRDLKSSNILIRDSDDEPVILDFGLARVADASSLTATGALLGTPATMAPEQVESAGVSRATDLYACGVLLYEMLAGRRPFTGDTLVALLHAVLNEAPEPPAGHRDDRQDPAVRRLESIALQLMEKDAARRPAGVDVVLAALDHGPGEVARPLALRALIALLPVLVVLVLVIAGRGGATRQRPKVGAEAALKALLKKHESFAVARGHQVLALGPRGRRVAALPAVTPAMPRHELFARTLSRDPSSRSAPQLAFRLAADRILIAAGVLAAELPPAEAEESKAAGEPLCLALAALAAGDISACRSRLTRARRAADSSGYRWELEAVALITAVLAFEDRVLPETLARLPEDLKRDFQLRGYADRAAADLLGHERMSAPVEDAWSRRRNDAVWRSAFVDAFTAGVEARTPEQRERAWRELDRDVEALGRLRRLAPGPLRRLGRSALACEVQRAREREAQTREQGPSALLEAWREVGKLALHLAEWDPAPRLPAEFPTALFAAHRFDTATRKHETPTAAEVFDAVRGELLIARTGFFHPYASNDVSAAVIAEVRARVLADPRFPAVDPVVSFMEARMISLRRGRDNDTVRGESIRLLKAACMDSRLGEPVRLEALSLLARHLQASGTKEQSVEDRLAKLRDSAGWPKLARLAEEAGRSSHPEPGRKAGDWLTLLIAAKAGDDHARRVAAAWREGIKARIEGDPRYFRHPTAELDRHMTYAWCALAKVELLAEKREAALQALEKAESFKSRRVESLTELLEVARLCEDRDRLRRLLKLEPVGETLEDLEATGKDRFLSAQRKLAEEFLKSP